MAKKETTSPAIPVFPMLKTVEQMSKLSGIGENKLRELMDSGELEYRADYRRRAHTGKAGSQPGAHSGKKGDKNRDQNLRHIESLHFLKLYMGNESELAFHTGLSRNKDSLPIMDPCFTFPLIPFIPHIAPSYLLVSLQNAVELLHG